MKQGKTSGSLQPPGALLWQVAPCPGPSWSYLYCLRPSLLLLHVWHLCLDPTPLDIWCKACSKLQFICSNISTCHLKRLSENISRRLRSHGGPAQSPATVIVLSGKIRTSDLTRPQFFCWWPRSWPNFPGVTSPAVSLCMCGRIM